MAISFDPSQSTIAARDHYHEVAVEQMRPISRKYDVEEHTLPKEWVEYYWQHGRKGPAGDWSGPNDGTLRLWHLDWPTLRAWLWKNLPMTLSEEQKRRYIPLVF